MEHVVFYPGAEGVPSFERVSSLDEAVSFVEQLRNSENITEFSVHAMTPVPLAFRAYYHVEVPASAESEADAAATDSPAIEVPSLAPMAVETPAPPAIAEPIAVPVLVAEDAPVVPALSPIENEPVAGADATADIAETPAAEPAAETVAPEVAGELTETETEAVADAAPVLAAVPDEDAPVDLAPIEATDDDRSAEWVAEASVIEPAHESLPTLSEDVPVEVPTIAAPVNNTPFATAPPVTVPVQEPVALATGVDSAAETADAVQTPSGRRSMGFFAR